MLIVFQTQSHKVILAFYLLFRARAGLTASARACLHGVPRASLVRPYFRSFAALTYVGSHGDTEPAGPLALGTRVGVALAIQAGVAPL
jgi:hypothetical protein